MMPDTKPFSIHQWGFSLADMISLWFVVHVVDPRDLKIDRPMSEEISHFIKVRLTNQNLRI